MHMQMSRRPFLFDNRCTSTASSLLIALSSQVDLLRSELMQERSARHDLEMDKSALERQVPLARSVPAQTKRIHTTRR